MHIKPATVAAQTRTRRPPAQRARRAPTIPSCNCRSRPTARRATKALRRAPSQWVSRERDRRGLRDRDHVGRIQGLRRQRIHRSVCIDERRPTRVTEHSGAALSGARRDRRERGLRGVCSEQKRKLIEQGFGWAKTIGSIRQVMQRGLKRVNQIFTLTMAAYNLTRMRGLAALHPQTQ